MKNGGRIRWSVVDICETFKISCLVGRLLTKGVLENHLKDQSFRLVHWLSITLSLQRISQESINLERKSYLDCSSDTLCTRREFGRDSGPRRFCFLASQSVLARLLCALAKASYGGLPTLVPQGLSLSVFFFCFLHLQLSSLLARSAFLLPPSGGLCFRHLPLPQLVRSLPPTLLDPLCTLRSGLRGPSCHGVCVQLRCRMGRTP